MDSLAAQRHALSRQRAGTIIGEAGYVDTGDMVELTNGRFYFRGRKGGVINVGGLKVFPEEVDRCSMPIRACACRS